MTELVPNYYHKFKCIADKCKHNCCIGWEILIDDETMGLYNAINTPFGEKIRANIEGAPPHFKLKENDRCPFLLKNGLCEIISEYGEDGICDICYLHPRFKNFYENFEETGLGLACEEAARIILTEKEKFSIPYPENEVITEEEQSFLEKRQGIFDILQKREISMKERLNFLAQKFEIPFDFSLDALVKSFISLERLDEEWTSELLNLCDFDFSGKIFKDENLQILFEQLSVYLIFRNLTDAKCDGDFKKRVRFTILSVYLLGAMFEFYGSKLTEEKATDLARMYSCEIEYAEENLDAVLNLEL